MEGDIQRESSVVQNMELTRNSYESGIPYELLKAYQRLVGNALAGLFCFVQDKFHLLKLDPTNYFVSFVPVNVSLSGVLILNIISFAVIMALLLIPCAFISRIDPADTVRVR